MDRVGVFCPDIAQCTIHSNLGMYCVSRDFLLLPSFSFTESNDEACIGVMLESLTDLPSLDVQTKQVQFLTIIYGFYLYCLFTVLVYSCQYVLLPSFFVSLLFYVLATPKVIISGRGPTCESMHSWRLYSAASLGHQAACTMTCHPTRSHYPETEPTSLIMPRARLGSDKYQF